VGLRGEVRRRKDPRLWRSLSGCKNSRSQNRSSLRNLDRICAGCWDRTTMVLHFGSVGVLGARSRAAFDPTPTIRGAVLTNRWDSDCTDVVVKAGTAAGASSRPKTRPDDDNLTCFGGRRWDEYLRRNMRTYSSTSREVLSALRITHCDSLMHNFGCGFSRRKLGQNFGKESMPNRVKTRCRGVQESSNQQPVRLTAWAHNPKVGGSNPPPAASLNG